ncbi:hypothetical protein OSTOST_11067, partial [Ostertagia ostertagi]
DRNGVGVAGDNSRELLIEPARNLALYRKTVEGGAVSQHSEESLESIHPTNGLEPGAMADYFRSPAFYWYLIILPALGINFLAYYSPNLLRTYVPLIGSMAAYIGTNYHWITVYTNVFALVAHIGESLYALYLCAKLKFSLSCSASWFVQTFLLGFPSLSILGNFAAKTKRKR